MGRFVFKLPDVGEGVAEAEIVKWHAAVGDEIGEEQPLVDIMTDKATVEIVSPVSGRIVSRNGEEGSKLAVGSEFVVFEIEGGETAPEPAAPKARNNCSCEPRCNRHGVGITCCARKSQGHGCRFGDGHGHRTRRQNCSQ